MSKTASRRENSDGQDRTPAASLGPTTVVKLPHRRSVSLRHALSAATDVVALLVTLNYQRAEPGLRDTPQLARDPFGSSKPDIVRCSLGCSGCDFSWKILCLVCTKRNCFMSLLCSHSGP